MTRPRLLDLFCGAGGAAVGYHRAGFDVVGVDNRPQPNYPFEFVQADALAFMDSVITNQPIFGFDAIHASPPCQAFTQMSAKWRGAGGKADSHPDLLTPTLELLRGMGLPWVVENVPGAKSMMRATLSLHGGMFGLGVHRPRLFESNVLLMAAPSPQTVEPLGVYGNKPDGRTLWRYGNAGNYIAGQPGSASKSLLRAPRTLEEASDAMGIDWMTWDELREAIPPAYTELIGAQLLAHLNVAA